MSRIGKTFSKNGYEVSLFGYPSRKQTIAEHSELLVADLKVTARKNPKEKIHFVTHSLGGIILRAALNHPECPPEAKQGRAVLISPPNRGTSFGRFLYYVSPIRKFLGKKTGHELLTSKNFDHLGNFPSEMEILVISGTFGFNPTVRGKNDGKVSVKESCLKTPHSHITTFSGHSWIMYSRYVSRQAYDFISNEPTLPLCTL